MGFSPIKRYRKNVKIKKSDARDVASCFSQHVVERTISKHQKRIQRIQTNIFSLK